MKKKKQIFIAIAALIVLAVLYVLIPLEKGTDEKTDSAGSAPRESYILSETGENEFVSLTIENNLGNYTLLPTEQGITVEGYEAMSLNQQTAGAISYGLRNLTSFEIIQKDSTNPENYGLEPPSAILTIKHIDNSNLRIKLGDAAPSGNGYYAMKEGDNTVYLLSAYMAGGFLSSVDILRDRTLPQLNYQDLRRLTIKGEKTIDIVPYFPHEIFSTNLSPFLMVKPYKRPTAVSTQKFTESLEAFVQNYQILDFIDERTVVTGLDDPQTSLYMKDGDGAELAIDFGNKTEEGSAVYARVRGVDGIITLPAETAGITEIKAIEMTDRFVRLIGIDQVKEVRIEYGDEIWTGTINWIDEDQGEFKFQGKKVEEDLFKKMYQEVLYLLFEGEIPSPYSPDGKADFIVSYIGDEKSPGRTSAEFYSYNQDYYAVSIDGDDPEFLIGKYQIEALLKYLRDFDS